MQEILFPSTQEYAQQYRSHEVLVIDDLLPPEFVATKLLPEVELCKQYIHRVKVGTFKKSGSVGRDTLQHHAPNIFSLYTSEKMLRFVESIVGEKLFLCPEWDQHAAALYYYTEPGDCIGVHYDKSFYRSKRFTVLIGLIQDSVSSKLVCYMGATKVNRRANPRDVMTHPGCFVVFNGDKLWHEVTPLGEGENERRVILTLEYVTDPRISFFNRFITNLKDRYLYFGKQR